MQVRIAGHLFSISEPMAEGHRCTKAEAQALNQARVENISNNMRKVVQDACAGLARGEPLPVKALAELQSAISKYDLVYQFLERHQSEPKRNQVEIEARALARERIEAKGRNLGRDFSDIEMEEHLVIFASDPDVQAEARARVIARGKVVRNLEDLA